MTSGLMSSLTGMLVGQIIIVDGRKPRKQIKESPRKESGEDAGRRWKMGTNYYVVKNGPSCQDPVHIGKASIGWMFSFQRQNEKWHEPPIVWNTFNQVKDWLKKYTVDSTDYVIIDEYDEIVSYDDFIEMVELKQERDRDNPDNFDYSDNVDGYRFTDGEFC